MSQQIDKHILKRYEQITKIGSGAYGHVWKVFDKHNKTIHALKKNFDAFQNSTDAQRTYRQIMFLQQLNHPNIIIFQKIIKSQNQNDIYLLFEYMDVDLYFLIRENMLEERHKKYIVYQIAKALYYVHSADLVHRDIKPSNILVNQDCIAKLCDFGLVRSINQRSTNLLLTQYIATRWYRAPQILLSSTKYTKAIDVWSFGCLLGQIIKGKPLFPGNSTLNQIQRVIQWTGPPSFADISALKTNFGKQIIDLFSKIKPINKNQFINNCPDDAMDLLIKTLQFNPDKRYTMQDILVHPYLSQFYNPDQIIVATQKITININDNNRLSLKNYRDMLYKEIRQKQRNQMITQNFTQKGFIGNCINRQIEIYTKPLERSKVHKPIHNKFKQKQCQKYISQIQGKGINILKKSNSTHGKRTSFSRNKYLKTQQDEITKNKHKTDLIAVTNIIKYSSDKKKSISFSKRKRHSIIQTLQVNSKNM